MSCRSVCSLSFIRPVHIIFFIAGWTKAGRDQLTQRLTDHIASSLSWTSWLKQGQLEVFAAAVSPTQLIVPTYKELLFQTDWV